MRTGKTIREVASQIGVSPRHLYRLKKQQAGDQRCDTATAAKLTTQLLVRLGHGELLGTPAQDYMVRFLTEFVELLGEHVREQSVEIDERWAKGSAHFAIEKIREAARRRQEHLDNLI